MAMALPNMLMNQLPDTIKDANHTKFLNIIESRTDFLSHPLHIPKHRIIQSYLSYNAKYLATGLSTIEGTYYSYQYT